VPEYTAIPPGYKRCTKCGEVKPATPEFFHRVKSRMGLRADCKLCENARSREWHQQHPNYAHEHYIAHKEEYDERAREWNRNHRTIRAGYTAKWRTANPEKSRVLSRKYAREGRERNPEKAKARSVARREYNRQWKRDHREDSNERRRKWREMHPEIRREKDRKYRAENRDKMRVLYHNYRARKVTAEGTHNAADTREIWERQEGKCLYCGAVLNGDAHLDHFIPLSHNGRNSKVNLAWACSVCNWSKNDLLPWNWPKWNGAYPVFWDGRLL